MGVLQLWLNEDLLPEETSRTLKHGFYAEFFDDGQLKHFAHYFNGSCDHGWHLELEHDCKKGVSQKNAGCGGTPDYEIYRDGAADMHDPWSDGTPPRAVDYEEWVRNWIARIVTEQMQARARDAAAEALQISASERELVIKKGSREVVVKSSPPNNPRNHFRCPRCSERTFQVMASLELDAADSDEIRIQLVRCPQCLFHGIAWYEESRRGAGESVLHRGFPVSGSYWNSIMNWMKGCPKKNDSKCRCASHVWLQQQGKFSDLSKHADWFNLTQRH